MSDFFAHSLPLTRYRPSVAVGSASVSAINGEIPLFGSTVAVPVKFEDFVTRIRALTGLAPRRASVLAGEFAEATRIVDPRQPTDDELIAKAKDLGFLPANWSRA